MCIYEKPSNNWLSIIRSAGSKDREEEEAGKGNVGT